MTGTTVRMQQLSWRKRGGGLSLVPSGFSRVSFRAPVLPSGLKGRVRGKPVRSCPMGRVSSVGGTWAAILPRGISNLRATEGRPQCCVGPLGGEEPWQ